MHSVSSQAYFPATCPRIPQTPLPVFVRKYTKHISVYIMGGRESVHPTPPPNHQNMGARDSSILSADQVFLPGRPHFRSSSRLNLNQKNSWPERLS